MFASAKHRTNFQDETRQIALPESLPRRRPGLAGIGECDIKLAGKKMTTCSLPWRWQHGVDKGGDDHQ